MLSLRSRHDDPRTRPEPGDDTVLRTEWRNGPDAHSAGPVLISVTDFTSTRFRDLPGVARAGSALGREWPHLEGAVGMWLWSLPLTRRSGSVSVWSSETALRHFIGLPAHVNIMRSYRERGKISTTTWWNESFDREATWRQARAWLGRTRT